MSSLGTNYTSVPDFTFFFNGVTGLMASNVLLGLPANIYVVWLIMREDSNALVSELFALNLAFSEILFCCSSFYVMIHFLLKMSLAVGVLTLKLSLQIMLISRPLFQTCICLERYLAVMHPTLFLRFKPLRYRLLCCVVDWLLILLDFIFPVFALSMSLEACLFISKSLVFFAILSYCGIRVLLVLKQPGPGDGGRSAENWNSMKRKAFKVIMITLVFNSTTQLLQTTMLGPVVLHASLELILQGQIHLEINKKPEGKSKQSPMQVKHNGLIQEMNHPTAGRIAVPGPAVRFSSFSPHGPMPPPLIGQHTVKVLREVLSYSDDLIKTLLASGAVAQGEVS